MRYTLILATAYLLIVEGQFRLPPASVLLLVVGALALNLFLTLSTSRLTRSPYLPTALVILDTIWVTAALLLSGRFSADFFYLYFFVLLLGAIGENVGLIAVAAILVCGAYLYVLKATGEHWSLWNSPSLIRIPFLFTAAVFYGYLVDQSRSERREVSTALRVSEERFRTVSSLTSDYAYAIRVTADGTAIGEWATQALERITGFTEREIEARGGSTMVVHPDDRPLIAQRWRRLLAGQSDVREFRIVRKDGTVRWVREHAQPVWEASEGRVVRVYGAAQDVTGNKADADALKRSEERFRALVENGVEAMMLIDVGGRLVYTSPNADRVFGRVATDSIGTPWSALVHPEDLPRCRVRFLELLEHPGETTTNELRVKHSDGTWAWIEATMSNLVTNPSVSAIVVNARDVTDRKHAEGEIRQLNTQLEQRVVERTADLARVNRELEAFSYSISHDLRAPLRAITGFSTALMEDYGAQLDAQGHHYLNRVCAATERMAALIDDLLALSRLTRSELTWQPQDLSTVARAVTDELAQRQPERAVGLTIHPGIDAVGDGRLLRIVMENLLGNAWKYTAKQAAAQIEFGMREQHHAAVYFVRDNGVGFDMAHAHQLFRPFQRLHSLAEFEGTGIGLATVQRIIHRHGGHVWADSAVGKGATFYFTLGPPP